MDDAYRFVFYDPKTAKALSKLIMSGGHEAFATQLSARLFALGATPFADGEQQDAWPGQAVR
jgi:hypothetical protein